MKKARIGINLCGFRKTVVRRKGCTCDDWDWCIVPPPACSEPDADPMQKSVCACCQHNMACHSEKALRAMQLKVLEQGGEYV